MSTGIFDPNSAQASLSPSDIERLLQAVDALEETDFGLSELELARLGPLLRGANWDWTALAETEPVERVVALIKLLALGEARVASWEAGADSPVIPLARALRARGDYPQELTRWLRTNSRNRFLPYGSLLDRL